MDRGIKVLLVSVLLLSGAAFVVGALNYMEIAKLARLNVVTLQALNQAPKATAVPTASPEASSTASSSAALKGKTSASPKASLKATASPEALMEASPDATPAQ